MQGTNTTKLFMVNATEAWHGHLHKQNQSIHG